MIIPDMFQDHGFGHDTLFLANEILQQGKLFGLQIDFCGPTETSESASPSEYPATRAASAPWLAIARESMREPLPEAH